MILGENNEKMSKSRGNTINPDDIVNEFGADTLRTYEMFIEVFDLSTALSNEGKVSKAEFNPVASHITEELWENMKFPGHLYQSEWPTWNEENTIESTIGIAV